MLFINLKKDSIKDRLLMRYVLLLSQKTLDTNLVIELKQK
jgi:hypothetical protein